MPLLLPRLDGICRPATRGILRIATPPLAKAADLCLLHGLRLRYGANEKELLSADGCDELFIPEVEHRRSLSHTRMRPPLYKRLRSSRLVGRNRCLLNDER